MKSRLLALTAIAALITAVMSGSAGAGEGAGESHLNPWSIDGALFAREAGIFASVDVPAACAAHYADWRDQKADLYEGSEAGAIETYLAQVQANEDALAAGLEVPYPAVPPTGTTTQSQFVASFLAGEGFPATLQQYIEDEWEPITITAAGVPCTGTGVLPAPPGGFVGIDLDDDPPPEADPCPDSGSLPFSAALWMWVPGWHEDAPSPAGGIYKVYDYGAGTFVFEWIPIVIGFELPTECLMIFPGDSASSRFAEFLPAATLDVLPSGPGFTGLETLLWYQLDDPNRYQVGPVTVSASAAGAEFVLTGWAWIDAVGWDMAYEGSDGAGAVWDVWLDFPDDLWSPATAAEYAELGGGPDTPAHGWVYETKDFYTIATGVSWRGFYQVSSIAGLTWEFTELYDPVTTWTTTGYRVDEIVGRVGG